jgi:hypothetical protein
MATPHSRRSGRAVLAIAAMLATPLLTLAQRPATAGSREISAVNAASVAALSVARLWTPSTANAAPEGTDPSPTANFVKTQIVNQSQKIEGSNYYVHTMTMSNTTILQVFKVPEDYSSYKIVATGMGSKWALLDASEKNNFFGAMAGKTPADFLPGGGSASQPTAQPVGLKQGQKESTDAKASGTAVKQNDGTYEVRFEDKIVDFSNQGSHVLDRKVDGTRIGELQYVGAGPDSTTKQKVGAAGRVAGNLLTMGIHPHANDASNKGASLNPHSTTITYATTRGDVTVNSDNVGSGGKGGGVIPSTTGPVRDAIVAAQIVRDHIDPNFHFPNEESLSKLVDTNDRRN